MASDALGEGQLKSFLERLVHEPLTYSLDLTYADLQRLSGGGALWVTATKPITLQAGDTIRLYNGRFSLPADQLPVVLSAAGKGDEDQANAQVAFLSAALSGAALTPSAQQSATIKAIAARHKGTARADARDLLGALVSGRVTVARLPSDGQTSEGQFAWRPDPAAITAQITRNAREFNAPYTVAVENGSGVLGIGTMAAATPSGSLIVAGHQPAGGR